MPIHVPLRQLGKKTPRRTLSGGMLFSAQGNTNRGTADGQRLLAHELTHVVQQTRRGGRASPVVQRKDAAGLTATVVDHGASEEAVKMAKARMNEVLGNLKDPAGGELKGATVELHIIPHDKKLTDLTEFKSLKGTKTFDGRNYDDLRGVGATKIKDTIRYAIAEEQLVKVKDKPSEYNWVLSGRTSPATWSSNSGSIKSNRNR